MKDIKAILEDHASALDAEATAKILREVQDNYRTVAEVEKKAQRISELEAMQGELAKQVESLEGAGQEVQALKEQVGEYQAKEKERLAQAQKATERASFEKAFDAALDGREFANDLVRESVFSRAMELCGSDSAVGVREAIESATKDVPGVWHNPQKDPAKMPDPLSMTSRKESGDEDAALRKMASSLFGRHD